MRPGSETPQATLLHAFLTARDDDQGSRRRRGSGVRLQDGKWTGKRTPMNAQTAKEMTRNRG